MIVKNYSFKINKKIAPFKYQDSFVVAVECDTKYGEVFGYGQGGKNGPSVILNKTEQSLHAGRSNKLTEISFPEFKKYSIAGASLSRYTLHIAFIKNPERKEYGKKGIGEKMFCSIETNYLRSGSEDICKKKAGRNKSSSKR